MSRRPEKRDQRLRRRAGGESVVTEDEMAALRTEIRLAGRKASWIGWLGLLAGGLAAHVVTGGDPARCGILFLPLGSLFGPAAAYAYMAFKRAQFRVRLAPITGEQRAVLLVPVLSDRSSWVQELVVPLDQDAVNLAASRELAPTTERLSRGDEPSPAEETQ
jgi:hypothetical protein